jgi:hypothetical protein
MGDGNRWKGRGLQMIRRRVLRDLPAEERDLESLPRIKDPIRIVINDPAFPLSLYLKNQNGDLVQSKASSRELYRISQTISNQIRFLPISGININIELYDRSKLKDYPMFVDVVLRVLYRACLIECMTASSVENVNVKYIEADRRKVVVKIEPKRVEKPSEPSKGDVTL